jgi:F420-dependent oxidoreductase-like protein
MKLAAFIDRKPTVRETIAHTVDLERAGLDVLWVNESYRFDAISLIGAIAARTSSLEIGTGILNVYSRTPALMAMTAAGCDAVSDGRFLLGLGASGPQIIEGFHGLEFERPYTRIREYIEACRMIWRRETFSYDGETITVPVPPGRGTGLGKSVKLIETPVRADIPIWWASLKARSVAATAEMCQGWLPTMFFPETYREVWGRALDEGLAKRPVGLPELEICAGGILAVGDDIKGGEKDKALDMRREFMALYIGGMGSLGANYYNEVFSASGYEAEARQIQELYLSGHKKEAEAAVPAKALELSNLVGTPSEVAERVAAYKGAGVTTLLVNTLRGDPLRQIRALRSIVDAA